MWVLGDLNSALPVCMGKALCCLNCLSVQHLSNFCMPSVLPATGDNIKKHDFWVPGAPWLETVVINGFPREFPLSTTLLLSTFPSPFLPPWAQKVSMCSFRLSRLSSWRVHAGLVSHGAVRQHQGTMVEKIIPHPLYSAQNHDYDVALLQLRTPINFSGEALALE